MSDSGIWRDRLTGILLVNMATLAWATNGVLGRWLRGDIGPFTLTTFRFTVAAIFFGALLRKRPVEERRYGRDKWWILGMGITGVVGFSPLLYFGLRHSTAVNCALIQGLSPMATALIAGAVIGEPVTRRQKIGAVLGFIGVFGLISRGSLSYILDLRFNPGDLVFLCSACVWAFYSVIGRRVMRHRSPVSATALSTFLSLPILAAAALVELQHLPLHLRWETMAAIAHICIVPTIIGYWAWNRSVRTLSAGGAMVFFNTLPFYGVMLGAVFLGEPLTRVHLIFGGLILGGGLWATLEGLRQAR